MNAELDSDDINIDSSNEDIILTRPLNGNEYIIHIDEDITSPSKYRTICNTIRNAGDRDILRLVVNSGGGLICSTIQIVNLILKTRAKVIAELYEACSAASSIVLSCDEIEVGYFSSMMIHCTSTGVAGKSHEIKSYIDFDSNQCRKYIKFFYDSFLTKDEIENVIKGQDIWLDADSINRRLVDWIPLKCRILLDNVLTNSKNDKKDKGKKK